MTSSAVESQLPQPCIRPIDQIFAALTLVPTVLLDSSLRILQVSASYLALNDLTLEECAGRDIYEFAQAQGLGELHNLVMLIPINHRIGPNFILNDTFAQLPQSRTKSRVRGLS